MKTTNPLAQVKIFWILPLAYPWSWTRGPRRVRPGRRPREAPLMHVAKEDLRAPPVYSPSALGKRAHGGVARRRLAIRPSWLRKLASTSTAFQRAPRSSARRVIRQTRTPPKERKGAGSRKPREIQLSLARCHCLFFETVPLLFRTLLWRRARLVVAVTAKCISVFDAHAAAFTRAGSRVPLPRALACTAIRLARNVIGRRARARGVDESTAGGLTGRSTVGSAGGPLRRVIRLRRAIRWRRTIAWRRRAILCICPYHPGGRSQNAHACDSDQSAFHRLPPFGQISAGKSNVRVKANVPNDAGKAFSLIAVITTPEGGRRIRRLREPRPSVSHSKGGCPGGVSGTLKDET
jgi:hypothetical protein